MYSHVQLLLGDDQQNTTLLQSGARHGGG